MVPTTMCAAVRARRVLLRWPSGKTSGSHITATSHGSPRRRLSTAEPTAATDDCGCWERTWYDVATSACPTPQIGAIAAAIRPTG